MSDALKALKKKVEADEHLTTSDILEAGLEGHSLLMVRSIMAQNSLDAARALHEALLPGWYYYIGNDAHSCFAIVKGAAGDFRSDGAASTARAWLLAILSALIAEGDE